MRNASEVPSVRSICFNTRGWIPTKKWMIRRHALQWRNADGDTLSLRVHGKPAEHLTTLENLGSLRTFYRQEAAKHGGGIVAVDIVDVGGIRSVKVINKYERRPAYAYDGTLTIPLKKAHFTIAMQSIERGVTGERDAIVVGHLAERGELEFEEAQAPNGRRRIKGWFQDPYDPETSQDRALYSKSDDERLDALFSGHPLSKIRTCLTQIQDSAVIDRALARNSVELACMRAEEEIQRARYLLSLETVGTLYLRAGVFDWAERLLADSVAELLERAEGDNDLGLAKNLLLLGLAWDAQGKYGDAEIVFSKARSIFEATVGEAHPDTAQALNNLGRVYISQGRHAEAEPLFVRALKVFQDMDVPGSNAGVALNGLGLVCNARGLYAQAIPLFEQALEIFERVHGSSEPDCAAVLRNMAFALRETGDDRRAKEALKRAQQIEGS